MKRILPIIITVFIYSQLTAQSFNMQNGNFTISCPGSVDFFDSGGSNGQYSNNEDFTITFCSDDPSQQLNIEFSEFSIENGWDALYIYDGNSTASPQISSTNGAGNGPNSGFTGGFWGTNIPGPFTSTNPDACLTFRFISDGSVTRPGWAAEITCFSCPPPTNIQVVDEGEDFITVTWDEIGSANEWQAFIVEQGQGPPTGGGVILNDTETTFSGLSSGSYEVYVQSICDVDDTSSLAGPFSVFILGDFLSGCPFVDVDLEVDIEGEVFFCPEDSCLSLTASFFDIGSTEAYQVEAIPHNPPVPYNQPGGNPVSVNTDDVWSNVIELPFSFCFFGEVYNEVKVGSNGAIQLAPTPLTDGGFHPYSFTQQVPSSDLTPAGQIFGVYHDINPVVNGDVNWYVLGSAPCRTFIVSFNDMGHFSCNSLRSTHMMVLYETTNIIEVYVQEKETCTGWNSGNALIGIQNPNGTEGYTPPGRNTGPWTVNSPEAWRFTPAGNSIVDFSWFVDDVFFSSDPTINLCFSDSTVVRAEAEYTPCDGSPLVIEAQEVILRYTDAAVPIFDPVFACDEFELPELPLGNYYTEPDGQGTQLNEGDLITSNQTIYIYDESGLNPDCNDESSFDVTIVESFDVINTELVDESCSGALDASIEIQLLNPVSGNVFSIDGGNTFSSNNLFENLSAGVYDIVVGGGTDCDTLYTVEVFAGVDLDYTISNDTSICQGESVQLLIDGNGASNFEWNPNIFINDNTISDPIVSPESSTTYIVTFEQNGCFATDSVIVTVSGIEVTNTIVTNESCAGAADGAIEILPAGEQYSIDGGVTFVNDNVFSGLAAGNYDIVVGGAANCDTAYSVTVVGGAPLLIDSIFTQDASCGNIDDGIIELYLSGGVAPLAYSIDSGVTSQASNIFNNLAGGDYDVLITDDLGCIADTLITISQPDDIDISIVNIEDLSCFGDTDGSAEFSVSGGTPDFEYSLDNVTFSPTNTFTNLISGNYTVYVQDDNACLDSLDFTIEEPDSLFINDYTISNISCFEENDGSITLEGIGGTLPYNYSVDGGNTFQTAEDFNGLSPGDYELIIEDGNSCFSNLVLDSITEPEELILSIVSSTDILCNGDATGSVDIEVIGGTQPYTFSWSNGDDTQNIFDLAAGNYEVTVADNNGCTSTVDTTLTEPDALQLTLTPTNISCPNGDDGNIESEVLGGTQPYQYAWSNGQISEDVNNLTAATYTLTVTDANDCEIQESVTLTEPEEMDVSFSTNQPSCFEGNDGSITATVNSGGTPPYQFTWDVNANNQTGETATDLEAGMYIVTVEDANGCIQTASTTLGEPTELLIDNIQVTNLTCFDSNDGAVSISTSGGTGQVIYEIIQDGVVIASSETGNFDSNFEAGAYIANVIDANGCETSENFTIEQPAQLELLIDDVSDPSCFGESDGSITVIAQNGEAPYTYELADGTTPVTGGVFVLGNGIYEITVTDANGCTATANQTLQNPPPVFVDIVADSTSIEMGEPLNLEAATENTTGAIVYEWSPDDGLSCADCQNPTAVLYRSQNIFLTVTDELGCTDDASLFIEVLENLGYFVPNAFTPGNADGTNDDFRVYGKNIQYVEMLIFNRWGEKLFEAASPFVTWDGTYKGELQQPGVYTYFVKITFLNGRSVDDKGSVTLIR